MQMVGVVGVEVSSRSKRPSGGGAVRVAAACLRLVGHARRVWYSAAAFCIAAQGHKGSARAWGQNRHYLFTPYQLAIDMLVESPMLPRLVRLLTPWLIVCGACLVQREIEACGSVARMPWSCMCLQSRLRCCARPCGRRVPAVAGAC